MSTTKNYTLLEHVSFTQVDDEAVLLNLQSGSYFGLNHVGTMLINAFEDGQTLSLATERISEKYQTELSIVLNDVNELIEQLLTHDLIKEIS